MKALVKKTLLFLPDESGPTVVEYAVMLALIIALCFVAVGLIGSKAKAAFTTLEAGLPEGS